MPYRLHRWLTGALAFAVAWVPATAVAEDLFAAQLTPDNLATHRVGGPDAIAGVGDWAFGNGVLCAAVSDPSHESILSPSGGVLIDLGHCGRADDQFNLVQPLMNLSRSNVVDIDELRPEVDENEARIVTRGERNGVVVETRYRLGRAHPDALLMETRLTRVAEGPRVFLFGDTCLHGHRQTSPFTASTKQPERSVGFAHPPVDVDSTLAMVSAIVPADLQVMIGGDRLEPGVSYGLQLLSATRENADGTTVDLPFLAINGEHFSLLGIFGDSFWVGGDDGVGLLELAQTLLMDLEIGESIRYERALWVGERADVASITDRIWPDAPRVSGRVDDASARLHLTTPAGAPVTHVRPDEDGAFAFRLPPGRYQLRALAPGDRELRREFSVGADDFQLAPIAVGAPARVALPSGRPMRLVFVGVGETATPRLWDDLLEFSIGSEEIPGSTLANHVSLAGHRSDPASVVVAPGQYRVLATRGPEFSVTEARLRIGAGETKSLAIDSPRRVLEPGQWLSADLHVHSEPSDDSSLPLALRMAAFAAEAAQIVVSTEHDRVVDYAPVIRQLGFAGRIASVIGAEVTSSSHSKATPHTFGHANAFPLPFRPDAYRGGTPQGEGRRLRALVGEVRGLGGARIVQLNHPRGSAGDRDDGSFFTHLAVKDEPFAPVRPLSSEPNRALIERDEAGWRDLDFDAIELMNGESVASYPLVRADWFSLLLQGEVRTGTANSDSHRLGEIVALPRNYVYLPGVSSAAFDEAAFVEALRGGRSYGTNGPLLEVSLGESGLGDLFEGTSGSLSVEIRAAPWVPVSTLRIWVNAELALERSTRPNVVLEIPLAFERDSFVTVEVEGRASGLYSEIAPGFQPLAFTNPIFVDADGDGRWSAPGLPALPKEPPSGLIVPEQAESGDWW